MRAREFKTNYLDFTGKKATRKGCRSFNKSFQSWYKEPYERFWGNTFCRNTNRKFYIKTYNSIFSKMLLKHYCDRITENL